MSLMTANLSGQIPTVLFMLGFICFIGIFGNILVIIVYALKHDRLTATLFILVLAISDFLACVTLIPGTMIIEYLEWNIDSAFLCKFYYFINNSFIPFSSLLIICIAFDRYFCLCHPFKNILTRECAKRIIFALICICLLLGFSSTFTVRIQRSKPELADSHDYKDIYINDSRKENQYNMTFTPNTILTSYSNFSIDLLNQIGEIYECTEITRLNLTTIDGVLYQIVQKFQTCSYILCIICVVTLYILIYRSVSKVFKKRLELKGIKMTEKKTKQVTGVQSGDYSKVNHTTMNALNGENKNKTRFHRTKNFKSSLIHKNRANNYNIFNRNSRNVSQVFTDSPNKPPDLSTYLQPTKPYRCQSFEGNDIHPCDEQPSSLEALQQQYEVGDQQKDQPPPHPPPPREQQPDTESSRSNVLIKPSTNNSSIKHSKKNFKAFINKLTYSESIQSFSPNCHTDHNMMMMTTANNEEKSRRSIKAKAIKDNIAFQNLKTAAMLFVVAVVYIVTFIPAMLMAIQYIPLYLPIFYLYYINNAINPIIYGFMNQNFRNDIRVLICQKMKCFN